MARFFGIAGAFVFLGAYGQKEMLGFFLYLIDKFAPSMGLECLEI